MDIGTTRIACEPICFALQYRYLDGGAPPPRGLGRHRHPQAVRRCGAPA
jgi:hypothetical protein